MLKVEKQLDGNITITTSPEVTLTLHSILEFFTRAEGIVDNVIDEEIDMANFLAEELNYYITHGVSEQAESEVIDYINDSYK
ncbi:hypothetical protein [Metabacillus arenae]|uniref:Uncharacterized protein n=1 Tax=Metabacillus arenae TaxID=2771434 RepID=A0A926NDC4_9BACI|nr:hypothetical protein [Metabacillus arenae]MBD1379060.1 hypothetical protein [Metabacillus arenae]